MALETCRCRACCGTIKWWGTNYLSLIVLVTALWAELCDTPTCLAKAAMEMLGLLFSSCWMLLRTCPVSTEGQPLCGRSSMDCTPIWKWQYHLCTDLGQRAWFPWVIWMAEIVMANCTPRVTQNLRSLCWLFLALTMSTGSTNQLQTQPHFHSKRHNYWKVNFDLAHKATHLYM